MKTKSEKRLALLTKYADKMHKGFCDAIGFDFKEAGGIRCLLNRYINCYYAELPLVEWDITITISLSYFPFERKVYVDIVIDKEIPKSTNIEEKLMPYLQHGKHYLLQPTILEKPNEYCVVEFHYYKENVGMKVLEDVIFDAISEYASDSINVLLDPIMTTIQDYKGDKNSVKREQSDWPNHNCKTNQ